MNPQNAVFKARINDEIEELNTVVLRVMSSWKLAKQHQNDLFLDAAALNLHGFYSGVEKIFEYIAKDIDHAMPSGNSWHRELVVQMAMTIDGVRPSVISKKTEEQLDDYRGFRHVVRNVYTYNLSEDRLKHLVDNLQPCFSQLKSEIIHFLSLID